MQQNSFSILLLYFNCSQNIENYIKCDSQFLSCRMKKFSLFLPLLRKIANFDRYSDIFLVVVQVIALITICSSLSHLYYISLVSINEVVKCSMGPILL